jgi:CDP-diacylglycerol--serine O-phosphatidyltransferase
MHTLHRRGRTPGRVRRWAAGRRTRTVAGTAGGRDPARTAVAGTTTGAGTGTGTRGGTGWRQWMNLANSITTLSLLSGVTAIYVVMAAGTPASPGRQQAAALLILACACLDGIDGPVARRRHTAGPFGSELDSLADLAAFGVAPAVIAYASRLHAIPVAGAVAALAWCACAAWRLARFPLVLRPGCFTGCPVPLAATTLTLISLAPPPAAAFLAALTASVLMVSTVPFPTLPAAVTRLRAARENRRKAKI